MALLNISAVGAGNAAERLITGTPVSIAGGFTMTAGTVTYPVSRVSRLTNFIVWFNGAAGIWRVRQTNLTGTLMISLLFAAPGQIVVDRMENPLQFVSGTTAGVLVVTESGVAAANEATITGKIE
jgi:hypothetical protein